MATPRTYLHCMSHSSENPSPSPASMAGPQPSVQPRRFSLLRCIVAIIVAAILFAGIIALIFWLVVRPSTLEFTVENAGISRYNLTDNTLISTFSLSIQAHNPNRHVSLYYDSIDVTVWYSGQMLAFTDTQPFFQPRHNVTMLDVDVVAQSTPLMKTVSANLKHDRSGGRAMFEVQVHAWVRFKVGVTKTKHYMLKVYCSPVLVHFSPSSVPFERTYCDVDM